MGKRIDLHTHSIFSEGTFTIKIALRAQVLGHQAWPS
jgi:histidinol phosphatase-like PHP family hydrolase